MTYVIWDPNRGKSMLKETFEMQYRTFFNKIKMSAFRINGVLLHICVGFSILGVRRTAESNEQSRRAVLHFFKQLWLTSNEKARYILAIEEWNFL